MTNTATDCNAALTGTVGKIESSLAEIRWTNRLLVIKEWLWPLLN